MKEKPNKNYQLYIYPQNNTQNVAKRTNIFDDPTQNKTKKYMKI